MPDVEVYMIANLSVNDAEEYRKYEKGFFPILKRFGEFFEKVHLRHKTPTGGSSVQCLVAVTAGVHENLFFGCFVSIV